MIHQPPSETTTIFRTEMDRPKDENPSTAVHEKVRQPKNRISHRLWLGPEDLEINAVYL